MKNILIILSFLVCGAVSAQKINQAFTQANGQKIVLNLDDVAFAYATDTGSTLVLGPAIKTLYVTESVDSVAGYSGGAFRLFDEWYSAFGRQVERKVAVSLRHVQSVVADNQHNTTKVKLRNPTMNLVLNVSFNTALPILTTSIFQQQESFLITDTTDIQIEHPGFYIYAPDGNPIPAANFIFIDSNFLHSGNFTEGDEVTIYFLTDVTSFSIAGQSTDVLGPDIGAARTTYDCLTYRLIQLSGNTRFWILVSYTLR